MPHRIQGVWAASVTPLTPKLDIDHMRFADHIRHLLETGCHGVAVFGSTGEGNSFTTSERIDACRRLAADGIPMDRILVGTGACAYPDAVTMSRAAHDAGAAGVLLHPPFYYKEPPDDGMVAFLSRLVEGVGDDLRLVLYHFPRLVGVGYSEGLLARLCAEFPEQVVGTKDSSGDPDRMLRLATALPGLAVLAGNEKYLLDVLQGGGAGCLTATTNLTQGLARAVFDGFADRSRTNEPSLHDLQAKLAAARMALETAPFIGGIKRLLADLEESVSGAANPVEYPAGAPHPWLRVRPPQEPLAADRAVTLRAAWAALSD